MGERPICQSVVTVAEGDLKFPVLYGRTGSSPVSGTKQQKGVNMNIYILVIMSLSTLAATYSIYTAIDNSNEHDLAMGVLSFCMYGTGLGFSIALL